METVLSEMNCCSVLSQKNTKKTRINNNARARPRHELCSVQVADLPFNDKKAVRILGLIVSVLEMLVGLKPDGIRIDEYRKFDTNLNYEYCSGASGAL